MAVQHEARSSCPKLKPLPQSPRRPWNEPVAKNRCGCRKGLCRSVRQDFGYSQGREGARREEGRCAEKAGGAPRPAAKKSRGKKKPAAKKTAAPKKPAQVKKATKAPAAAATNPVIKLKDTIMATCQEHRHHRHCQGNAGRRPDPAPRLPPPPPMPRPPNWLAKPVNSARPMSKLLSKAARSSSPALRTSCAATSKPARPCSKTVTGKDAKKVAAIKSPTELMQLQGGGEIAPVQLRCDGLVRLEAHRSLV